MFFGFRLFRRLAPNYNQHVGKKEKFRVFAINPPLPPFDKGGLGGFLGQYAFWFRLGRVRFKKGKKDKCFLPAGDLLKIYSILRGPLVSKSSSFLVQPQSIPRGLPSGEAKGPTGYAVLCAAAGIDSFARP